MAGISKKAVVIVAVLLILVLTYFVTNSFFTGKDVAALQEFVNRNLKDDYANSVNIEMSEFFGVVSYDASWDVKGVKFHAAQRYGRSDDKNNNFYLSAEVPVNATRNNMGALAKTFYTEIKEDWKCVEYENSDVCESFWDEGTIKQGVTIVMLPEKTFVQICEIPLEDVIYDTYTCSMFKHKE